MNIFYYALFYYINQYGTKNKLHQLIQEVYKFKWIPFLEFFDESVL